MQIEVKIDRSCTEPKVIIVTDKITDEINHLMKKLSDDSPQMLSGFKDDMLEIIDESDIISVYACSGKVFAITEKGEYTLRLKLYEIEERLDKNYFVRISNSEIINLRKVKSFDLSFTGTICVKLSNDTVTYVSRRRVGKVKKY